MSLRVQDSGTLRTITVMQVRQAGITRTIREVKVQDGGTLRTVATFADPLSVSAPDAYGEQPTTTVTTNSITATPSGGFSPFTYAWTLITNGGGTASTASSPSLATTSFTKTGLSPGMVMDVWRVTVTDAIGTTATADIDATFFNSFGTV